MLEGNIRLELGISSKPGLCECAFALVRAEHRRGLWGSLSSCENQSADIGPGLGRREARVTSLPDNLAPVIAEGRSFTIHGNNNK